MEGNIAATYILIFRFLKQQSQHKAAEAVKKAAKAIVVLRDDIEQEGPPLEDIIKEWKTKENTKSRNVDSSSVDTDFSKECSSDSDKDSGSDPGSEDTSAGSESEGNDISDSDDSSGDSDHPDGASATKKLPTKASERDTSVTLSSAAENAREAAKQVIQAIQTPKKNGSEPNSSDLDGSSESSGADSSDVESSSTSPSSSGSSESSDEDEGNANEKVPSHRMKTTEDKGPSTSDTGSDSDDKSNSKPQKKEESCVAKKRKTSENGVAVTTAVVVRSQQITRAPQRKEKLPPKIKERFQRVKVQNLAPELLLNNGFEARGAAANDYGERAHRDLVATRGAGFRKEKNKKKRGSYRGGEITMESHSIKFDF